MIEVPQDTIHRQKEGKKRNLDHQPQGRKFLSVELRPESYTDCSFHFSSLDETKILFSNFRSSSSFRPPLPDKSQFRLRQSLPSEILSAGNLLVFCLILVSEHFKINQPLNQEEEISFFYLTCHRGENYETIVLAKVRNGVRPFFFFPGCHSSRSPEPTNQHEEKILKTKFSHFRSN